jgi:hypothetical protein
MTPITFKTHQIEHPDKKVGKDGKVLQVTVYTAPDGNEYTSSDIITVGSGKTAQRYLKSELTDAEMKQLKSDKGMLVLRKLANVIADFEKRVENAMRNGGVVLSAEDRETLANYAIGKTNSAVESLRKTKSVDADDNPF